MRELSRLLNLEFRKITSLRIFWIFSICVILLSAVGSFFMTFAAMSAKGGGIDLSDGSSTALLLSVPVPLYCLCGLALGVYIFTVELRYNSYPITLLLSPSKLPVIFAKLVIAVVFQFTIVSISSLTSVAVTVFLLKAGGFDLPRGIFGIVGSSVVVSVIWAVAGLALGLLLRSMVAAILVSVVFVYFLETIIAVILRSLGWDLAASLLPSSATNSAIGGSIMNSALGLKLLSPLHGFAVVFIYALALLIAGVIVEQRRET